MTDLSKATPLQIRAQEAAHALIHMAGQYEGYDQRKQRYAAALVDFAKEAVANRMISEANERRQDDALFVELVAALRGVIRVADRKTDEFDAARAALAKAEAP